MSRAKNRELQKAETYLDSLINLYVKYKNKFSYTVDSQVVIPPHVSKYRLQLEAMWIRYCETNNSSKNRVVFLRTEAFKERFLEKVDNHKKMAWFARVREICLDKYGFEPNFYQILNTYEKFTDPEESAIFCVKNIPLDAHF